MTRTLPSLANADWLTDPPVRSSLRRAGGCRRGGARHRRRCPQRADGRAGREIDFATTATPDKVTALAEAAGIKAVPTGIEHGTVTLVDRRARLRGDDAPRGHRNRRPPCGRPLRPRLGGRRAPPRLHGQCAFGRLRRRRSRSRRRLSGHRRASHSLHRRSPTAHRRGSAAHPPLSSASMPSTARAPIDAAGLSAAIRAREGLRELSAERIGQEMRRIVIAPRAAETVAPDAGIRHPHDRSWRRRLSRAVRGGLVAFEADDRRRPRRPRPGSRRSPAVSRKTCCGSPSGSGYPMPSATASSRCSRGACRCAARQMRTTRGVPSTGLGAEAFRDGVVARLRVERHHADDPAWQELYQPAGPLDRAGFPARRPRHHRQGRQRAGGRRAAPLCRGLVDRAGFRT